MKKVTLIKLGGSVITDKSKPYTARPEVIRRLAQEIKTGWDNGYRFVASHGGGSFPHTSAHKCQTQDGIKKKEDIFGLAVVQQDAFAINRIVNQIFLEEGLPCLTFAPSSFTFADNKNMAGLFAQPMIQALRNGNLPLTFGDIILDQSLGCCIYSGETTLDNLIKPLQKDGLTIERVIQCGNTDGIYDENKQTISKITPATFKQIKKFIGESGAVDVTGGMLHKLQECLKIAEQGIDSLIINGEKEGNLLTAILGKDAGGTLITK